MLTDPYRQLLWHSLLALVAGAAGVALCYFYVDRPVARFVYDSQLPSIDLLRWMTLPPPYLQSWAPAIITLVVVRRAWGPFRRWERVVLAAAVAVVLADQFRQSLSYLFGRDWPETWTHNNPSLIGTGAYGFHPFGGSQEYGSFPSGHTARTAAVAAAVWVGYRRWRWACVLATAAVIVGLIGMDYHFVGDVVGGGVVGGLVGVWTARLCGVWPPDQSWSQV
ncbi:MAG: phosphatase PAP2 family protein [Gemmataceae bacterium]|nr:phosphatase PAP2 family protein [Gemmataceae bacterium]